MDIYFLMDLSGSMKTYKENLQTAAEKIAIQIKELTADYTIGFGSYSDKPTFPFAREKEDYE